VTRIAIDPSRPVGRLDRKVFGGFVEHLGRCIYGGLYEEDSPLSDDRGFRKDVLGLLRELKLGVLRWPGGNFVSNYHWADGIGPKDARPRRPELAWGGEEPNRFGTDEFLAYCEELGTEPYICLNMGTGTLDEALAWVEYCNLAGRTYWAERRRANGRAGPYPVTYWELGNEMYGEWQVGALSAEEYVSEATRWARAIRMLDPRAKLVACGMNGWNGWDRVVVDGMAGLVDYHSLHIYTGSDDYWTNVLQPHQAERAIRSARALIERAAYRQRIATPPRIAYDEWNVWYRQMTGALEERYTFADALAVGTYLNIFIRNCDWVRIACLAQMVNAIAPVVTSPDVVTVQPTWYPVFLHAQAALDMAVDVHVDGPSVSPDLPAGASRWPFRISDLGPFKLIDAAATVSAANFSGTVFNGSDVSANTLASGAAVAARTGRVAVTLVNRSPSDPETAEVLLRDHEFDGPAMVRTVTAGLPGDARTLPDVETAHLESGSEDTRGGVVVVRLPPRSFTVIEAAMTSR
jgi:alpha-L-arabinofuranosidase